MALRKTALAAALMGLAGAANAGSLATSVLEVQDFTLLHSDGSVYAFSDFELLVATNSADVFADLDTTAPASDGDSDTVGVPAGNTAEIDLGRVEEARTAVPALRHDREFTLSDSEALRMAGE